MRKKIHTILALAAATALWTGCSEASDPGLESGSGIRFSCGAESRVQETTAGDISSFRVSAVWTKAPGNYVHNYMTGQLVEKNGSGDWVYSPIRTMPSYGAIDFFAYSPANASVSDFTIGGPAHDQVSMTYSLTNDPEAQQDFMVAQSLEATTPSVYLNFQHMLSSVRVKARSVSAGLACRIREVRLLNFFRQGRLDGITSTSPKMTVWKWDTDPGLHSKSTYTIAQPGAVDVVDAYLDISDLAAGPLMILPQTVNIGDETNVVEAGDIGVGVGKFPAWMLGMPKDVETSAYVAVTYDVWTDDMSTLKEKDVTTYIHLSDPLIPGGKLSFVPGKRYVFRIDLKYPTTRSSAVAPSASLHVSEM